MDDILDLYPDRFGVNDDFARRRLQQTLYRNLGRLHLVPTHIEEFVKAGIKRARLAHRAPEYLGFEPASRPRSRSLRRSLRSSRLTAKEGRQLHPFYADLARYTDLARPERFELPTPRFVVWCSIQLSYGRGAF
jgi:hypothetical protein